MILREDNEAVLFACKFENGNSYYDYDYSYGYSYGYCPYYRYFVGSYRRNVLFNQNKLLPKSFK